MKRAKCAREVVKKGIKEAYMKEEKFTYQVKQLATREDWEKARMDGIGTSEIAAACGKEAVKKRP